MAKYKRCPEAKDDACGKVARIKRAGALYPEEPQNNYYICTSEKECKKTGDTDCHCFVVAIHMKVKNDDPETIEEVPYLAKNRLRRTTTRGCCPVRPRRMSTQIRMIRITRRTIGRSSAVAWRLMIRVNPSRIRRLL